ncbi:hypothetical protein PTKIN_Ptkin02bG0162700 [Pterospermum kingtungense]
MKARGDPTVPLQAKELESIRSFWQNCLIGTCWISVNSQLQPFKTGLTETGEQKARIAQGAGHVTEIDWNDSIPHNLKFIRVKVSIDPKVPLIAGVMLRREDEEMMWVDIIYEKIHKACQRCGMLGHTTPRCPQMTPELELIINEQMEEINKGSGFEVGCKIQKILFRNNHIWFCTGNSKRNTGTEEITGMVEPLSQEDSKANLGTYKEEKSKEQYDQTRPKRKRDRCDSESELDMSCQVRKKLKMLNVVFCSSLDNRLPSSDVRDEINDTSWYSVENLSANQENKETAMESKDLFNDLNRNMMNLAAQRKQLKTDQNESLTPLFNQNPIMNHIDKNAKLGNGISSKRIWVQSDCKLETENRRVVRRRIQRLEADMESDDVYGRRQASPKQPPQPQEP